MFCSQSLCSLSQTILILDVVLCSWCEAIKWFWCWQDLWCSRWSIQQLISPHLQHWGWLSCVIVIVCYCVDSPTPASLRPVVEIISPSWRSSSLLGSFWWSANLLKCSGPEREKIWDVLSRPFSSGKSHPLSIVLSQSKKKCVSPLLTHEFVDELSNVLYGLFAFKLLWHQRIILHLGSKPAVKLELIVRKPGGSGENVLLGGAGRLQSCPPQNLGSHFLGSRDEVVIPGRAVTSVLNFTIIVQDPCHHHHHHDFQDKCYSTSQLPPAQGTVGSALKKGWHQMKKICLWFTFKLLEGRLQVVAVSACLRAVGSVAPPEFSPWSGLSWSCY